MRLPLLLLILLLYANLHGQDVDISNITNLKHNQAEYIHGELAFKKYLHLNFHYPNEHKYGTMIGIIEFNQSEDKLNTIVVNSLGKSFDIEFERLVKETKGKWKRNDSTSVLYKIVILECYLQRQKRFFKPEDIPSHFTNAIAIKYVDNKLLETEKELERKLDIHYTEKKLDSSLMILNELIRRNPLKVNFYVTRIQILTELQQETCLDYWILTELLGHNDFKIKNQNTSTK